MSDKYACIVKKSRWFSNGFDSWCGRTYETSQSAGWFTPTCRACEAAKKKATQKKAASGGWWS
jgi:hypothetical protein